MSEEPYIRRTVEDTFFIHNCFGSFFSGVLDWFGDKFYPRFQYKVIGTYDKAVKFFNDKKQMTVDPSDKLLPSLSLDPMLDFSQEERGGRFLWQHSTYAPGLGMRLWKGIDLKEQDIMVNPVFSRYQGTFEMTFWMSSVYELIDFRVALLQFSGGYNRWLRPEFFWSYLILPEKIENFEKDPVTHEIIDWSNTLAETIHVDTINKHRLAVPIALDPIWRLESLGDSSTKYGGDQVAEYKLSGTFGYEINLPTYMVLSRGLDPRLSLSFSLGKTYTRYPLASPFKILQTMEDQDVSEKYIQKNFKMFTIADKDKEKENLIVTFTPDCITYPQKIPTWNWIIQGELLHLTSEWLLNPENKVHKHHILYFDRYQSDFLASIRKCGGVICKNDVMASMLYSKCESLQKPLITYLTDQESNIVKSYFSQNITLDTLSRKLYSGILESEQVTEQDPVSGFNTVEDIKRKDPELYDRTVKSLQDKDIQTTLEETRGGPEYSDKLMKRLLKDECDGIQKRFYLNYVLDESKRQSLLVYVDKDMQRQGIDYTLIGSNVIEFLDPPPLHSSIYIGGHLLVIRDSKLIAIYEFTQEDVDRTDPIIVDLPKEYKVERQEDLVLVSYIGRMEFEKDYSFDQEHQKVTIMMKPIKDEIVQFFYYVLQY
jgi:phosphohistidine swiveling domain-containing protein